MSGILSIVSTPIGNLDDISIRAVKTLFSADTILCEDTRRSGNLLNELKKRFPEYNIESSPQLISYYDEIEEKRLPEMIQRLEEGAQIALISDNGTPTISDPGFRLVREARKRNLQVSAVPGPSAVVTALSISGLPTNHFTFLGFLPEKSGARVSVLKDAKTASESLSTTYILYCAPHKFEQTLIDIQSVFGNREIVLARELTKIHEEVLSKQISEFLLMGETIKGECVILLHC